MKEKALSYLEKNYLKHVCAIECLKLDKIKFFYVEDDGVVFLDESNDIYSIATDSPDVCLRATQCLSDVELLFCHNGYEKEILSERFGLKGNNQCYQIVWQGGKLTLNGTCDIKRLEPSEENVEFVFNHYTLAYNIEHIRYMMQNIGIFGAYYKGELAGFIGIHDEHSIGLLEVMPEYRRLGIGTELVKFLVNKNIDDGITPFEHIIYTNEKSIAMHKKLGFTFSDSFVYWLY